MEKLAGWFSSHMLAI